MIAKIDRPISDILRFVCDVRDHQRAKFTVEAVACSPQIESGRALAISTLTFESNSGVESLKIASNPFSRPSKPLMFATITSKIRL